MHWTGYLLISDAADEALPHEPKTMGSMTLVINPHPQLLESPWNAAAATGGERRQRSSRERPAAGDQGGPASTSDEPQRGTVTPEVAGSSPVAPALKSPHAQPGPREGCRPR
jgi:hypothetical protein